MIWLFLLVEGFLLSEGGPAMYFPSSVRTKLVGLNELFVFELECCITRVKYIENVRSAKSKPPQ